MNEQLNLFDDYQNFSVIEGEKYQMPSDNMLKCFKSELVSVEYLTLEELFSGFNTIKAITFSYDVGFIDKIMSNFDYGEIVLGGNFLVQKDSKMTELIAEVCTNAYEAGRVIKKYDNLVQMLSEGNIEFRTPQFVLDHRKIYLLKADDGRTRVIKGSANMSKKAWNNSHIEHYEYDDTEACYMEYEKDFETAWQMSEELPLSVISSKKSDDLVESNAILKGIKETGQTIILKQSEDEIFIDNIKYAIDHEAIKEEYKALLEGVNTKVKDGIIEIVPKTIEKIEHNCKKLAQKKIKINNQTEQYPTLEIDYYNKECRLSGSLLNLSPTEDEVKHDLNELLSMFENFNYFVGDTTKLKETHFKLLNAIFSSPFNAKLRCTAKLRGLPTSSLPMFLLAASSTANCGKTFTISLALKMMTGKELSVINKEDCKKDDIRAIQVGCKSIPVFIDELDNKYLATIKDVIKNVEKCEDNQLEDQPMILFASNDVLEPDVILRKRMVFLRFEGALPSNIDQSSQKGKGNAIIKRLGTGFYREYLKRMLVEVTEELDYMIHSKDIPDEYYTDLMAISSNVIISIFKDFGYDLPDYITTLSWNDDYSVNAKFIAENAIEEIDKLYKQNRKCFTVNKDIVIIELGIDRGTCRKCESWKNTLPTEMKPEFSQTRDYCRITINRKELERHLGYKLGTFKIFSNK